MPASGEDGRLVLTLYSREYCHLCHDMLALVEPMRERFRFDIQVRDVDADPGLEERFGELVPVLMHQERELARYRLDPRTLETYLLGAGAA
jgi:hypothetical protein